MLPRNQLPFITVFYFFLLSCNCNIAYARSDLKINELQQIARAQQLWLNPEWLNLLHYKKSGSNFISHVDDADFFNAADGKTNPEAEPLATLSAFYNTASPDDQHPQCRFPARLDWLNRQLDNGIEELPATNCSLYKEWRPISLMHS